MGRPMRNMASRQICWPLMTSVLWRPQYWPQQKHNWNAFEYTHWEQSNASSAFSLPLSFWVRCGHFDPPHTMAKVAGSAIRVRVKENVTLSKKELKQNLTWSFCTILESGPFSIFHLCFIENSTIHETFKSFLRKVAWHDVTKHLSKNGQILKLYMKTWNWCTMYCKFHVGINVSGL